MKTITRLEHITFSSELDLFTFGEKLGEVLLLPPLQLNYDNGTEWLCTDHDHITYDLTRSNEEGLLQQWDSSVPEESNFGLVLLFHKTHPHAFDNNWVDHMIAKICGKLATVFNTKVYHHRSMTFDAPDNERTTMVFHP
jgi:hypothetical protein